MALLLGAAGALAVAPAGAGAIVPFHGVNIGVLSLGTQSPADLENELARAHELHANVVRTEFAWRAFQPTGPGALNPTAVAVADGVVNRAHRLGIKLILTLDSTPCWASSAPADLMASCSPSDPNPAAGAYPPADPNTFAKFAAALAARYRGKVEAIEVWNEPDHEKQYYFAGPDKPRRYAAILRAAYPAIKRADRHVQVLGGSLVGANGNFLRALYANGIKGFYDGISVHYYDIVLGSLRAIRDTQRRHHDSTPLWLDEFGWTTCLPQLTQGGHACVSDSLQARDLSDIFAAVSRTPYVKAAVIFNLYDYSAYNFGLLTANSARKPAFSVVARIFEGGHARLEPVRLHLRRARGRLVAYGSAPAGDSLEIDVYSGSNLRYKATFDPDRFNRYSIALPGRLGTRGLRVRVYQYWTGEGAWAQF